MVDLAPTAMLDPIVKGWAEEAGMRTEQLSMIVGGNFIGGLVGVPLDMFLTQLGSKVASLFLGGAATLFGTYSLKGKGRVQTDTMQIGMRILTEFLDPSPDDIKAIQRQIGDFVDGIVQGRWDKVAYAFIRNPREFQGMLSQPEKNTEQKTETNDKTASDEKKTGQTTYPKGPGKIHKL